MVFLAGYFYSSTSLVNTKLKTWIFIALLFSWLGDILLMFRSGNEMFFLSGLTSFLLAHIFYCIFFHKVRIAEQFWSRPFTLVIVVAYYTALMILLTPWLAGMKIPVRVYGLVISFMFMLAMHMLYLKNQQAGKAMMIGALFFVISDSILAIDKFYLHFELAGVMVMFTYGLAQWLLVSGAVQYLRDKN